MTIKKIKAYGLGLTLLLSANIGHTQISALITTLNDITAVIPAAPGLDAILQQGAELNSQLLGSLIPLSNDLPLVGPLVGELVPIGTQIVLPLLLNPPADLLAIDQLVTTAPSSLLDVSFLLPGQELSLIGLPMDLLPNQ